MSEPYAYSSGRPYRAFYMVLYGTLLYFTTRPGVILLSVACMRSNALLFTSLPLIVWHVFEIKRL